MQAPVRRSDLIEMLWDRGDWDAVWEVASNPDPSERMRCAACVKEHNAKLSARISDAREPFWQVMSKAEARELLFTDRQIKGTKGPPNGSLELNRDFAKLEVDVDRFFELAAQSSLQAKVEALGLIEGPILVGIEGRMPDEVDISWLWDARAEQRAMIEGLVSDLLGGGGEDADAIVERIYEDGEGAVLSPDRGAPETEAPFNLDAFRKPLDSKGLDLLQDCAGDTFKDLVRIWTGHDDVLDQPLENYRRLRLDSWWGGVEGLEMTWRIHAASAPQLIASEALGTDCVEWTPGDETLDELRTLRAEPGPLLLAIAVPQKPDLEPAELWDERAEDRFHWYCVDLGQFFDHTAAGERSKSILIPLANKLDLSLFSLLWGSHWVKTFFEPLSDPRVAEIPALSDFVTQIYATSLEPRESITELGWNFLDKVLPSYATNFDADTFPAISFRLGLGSVLQLIRGQLRDDLSSLTDIRNYCPEALYGTINLWLFSRAYHHFMLQTAEVAANQAPLFTNQRFLPLAENSVSDTPRMLRTAAWNVMLCYRQLLADVRLVQRPASGAGNDHSFYGGGGIGHFPWMKVSAAGANWMIEAEDRGSKEEHQDFLDEQAGGDRTIIAVSDSAIDAADTLRIVPKRLNPPKQCPILLFPPEDRFLAYPRWLWGPGVLSALSPQSR